jgi:hypothetical protein
MFPQSFSPQESGSDFASVVAVDQVLTPWQKLDDDSEDPFTLLHAKWWGKSMAIEEQEWRRYQSLDPGGDDSMDEDVDKGLETDVDDDVIPGCYLLDLGDDFSEIWIRADYIRIYDFLEAHYKTNPAPSFRAPAAVITGQPGVGEFRDDSLNFDLLFKQERVSGSTTPCVDASLNGGLSSGTTIRGATSLWKKVFMNNPSTSNQGTSRPSCGLWSTQTSPRRGFLPFSLHMAHTTMSSTPPLHTKNGGRVCTRPCGPLLSL